MIAVYIIIGVCVLLGVTGGMVVHHQLLLKQRAQLMREAMHNRDFSFRLPTDGLLPGERELQETLNDFGVEVRQLMAQSEVESWQRLTRVLTHEIMNSIAPISSISQSYLNSKKIKESGMEEGLRAIHDTSLNLGNFVESYRKLTQLQKPVPEKKALSSVVENIVALYPTLQWHIDIPTELEIETDYTLLRQVLVNIIKNAMEAEATDVDIRWGNALLLSNNGKPIPAEVIKDIFVPFFTTKQSGSGIGLSLSKQIMTLQGHDLQMAEMPLAGYSVTFVITL